MKKFVDELAEIEALRTRITQLEEEKQKWKDRALREASGYSIVSAWNRDDALAASGWELSRSGDCEEDP